MSKKSAAPWSREQQADKGLQETLRKDYGTSLLGWYFFTPSADNPKDVNNQGLFVQDHGAGNYTVQLFSWLTGGPTDCRAVHLMEVIDDKWWLFPDFDTKEAWIEKFNKREASREKREDRIALTKGKPDEQ